MSGFRRRGEAEGDSLSEGTRSPVGIAKIVIVDHVAVVRDGLVSMLGEEDRKYRWPLGRRPDEHPGSSSLGL